jgi:hypothetical protein
VEILEINRLRRGNDPNSFVIGVEGYQRYMDINIECIGYAAAREGQKMQVKRKIRTGGGES